MSTFLEVLVNLPLPQSFTYKNLDSQNKKYKPTTVGMRCEIYFGSRKMIGCIINISHLFTKVEVSCNYVFGFSVGAGVGFGLEL